MCKDKKNDSQKPLSSSELRGACKYMIKHPEEFIDFEIYKSLNTALEFNSESEAMVNLHNRFAPSYKLLIGEKTPKSDENSKTYFDIMPSIDESSLRNPKTLSQILAVFHHFINKDEVPKRLKATLISVDIEKSDDLMDYLINKLDSQIACPNSFRQLNTIYRKLKEDLKKEFFEEYKSEAVSSKINYHHQIDFFAEKLVNKSYANYIEFGKLSPSFQAWLYTDLCCWSILQFVIHGIMRNKQNPNKCSSIKRLDNEIIRLIEQEEKVAIKLEGSPEEIMFKLYSYYYEKDYLLQDIHMLDYITGNKEFRKTPSPEYSLIRFSPHKKSITWQEILDLFSEEAPKKSLKSFKENLLKCYTGIFQFNERSGRNLKPDPITLRAFYRELYMGDTLYDRKQGMTIFHDFLKQNEMRNVDYYFIDEKINMGIFREYGLIDEFYAKNNLQKNLYYLVCQIWASLDPLKIIENLEMLWKASLLQFMKYIMRIRFLTNLKLSQKKKNYNQIYGKK